MSRTMIANPAALRRPVKHAEGDYCIFRADAPVCENGEQDVTCTGEFRRPVPISSSFRHFVTSVKFESLRHAGR